MTEESDRIVGKESNFTAQSVIWRMRVQAYNLQLNKASDYEM